MYFVINSPFWNLADEHLTNPLIRLRRDELYLLVKERRQLCSQRLPVYPNSDKRIIQIYEWYCRQSAKFATYPGYIKQNGLLRYAKGHLSNYLAEREGFEPSVPLPVRQFSKLFLSATQASLRIK